MQQQPDRAERGLAGFPVSLAAVLLLVAISHPPADPTGETPPARERARRAKEDAAP